MKRQENESPYILKIEDMVVEFEYSDVKKTLNECMVNILKQKRNYDIIQKEK